MSLRTRLWFVLGGVILIPVVGALVLLTLVVPRVRTDQAIASLRTNRAVVVAQLRSDCAQLGLAARGVALEAGADSVRRAVATARAQKYADYAAVLSSTGAVVAESGTAPGSGAALTSCSRGPTDVPWLAERVPVRGVSGAAEAVTAIRLTPAYLGGLRRQDGFESDVEIAVLQGRQVLATTLAPGTARQLAAARGDRVGRLAVRGWLVDVVGPSVGVPVAVAVAQPRPDSRLTGGLVVLGLAVAGLASAGVLVTVIARALTRPLAELTEAAQRVATGDLDVSIGGTPAGAVGRLSEAFDGMTAQLRLDRVAVEQSRADLRDSLERIGATLKSTHDMDGLLQVVLDAAVANLQVRVGLVLYGAPHELRVVAQHGAAEPESAPQAAPVVVQPGVGVLGRVLSTGRVVRGRLGADVSRGDLQPAETEPAEGDILAVPLRSRGEVPGVIALYDRVDGRPFSATDEDAMRTLAGQAVVAIENVLLHQEAERLSTTDALTGVWNFRYLSMSLAREIERSSRFHRPLAVLMLDLDHFKAVNDTYGHARGDSVLREIAQRVQEHVREVDTFARYGGEEFVVVLPETSVEGATQLADRICQAVRREPFTVPGEEPLHVTVSIGGAAFPAHGSSAATLMRAADKALYVAKEDGRDRWHMPEL